MSLKTMISMKNILPDEETNLDHLYIEESNCSGADVKNSTAIDYSKVYFVKNPLNTGCLKKIYPHFFTEMFFIYLNSTCCKIISWQ